MFSFSFLILILTLTICYSLKINGKNHLSSFLLKHYHHYDHKLLMCTSSDSTNKPVLSPFKQQLASDMKEAMKNKDKVKLSAVRAIQTAIKQLEVDDRIEVTEAIAIEIMSKLIKQRKESIKSYLDGNRPDLVDSEQLECDAISSYMPIQLSQEDIENHINIAIQQVDATSVKDMGKVMNILKPLLLGKADMSDVGNIIKKKLSNI